MYTLKQKAIQAGKFHTRDHADFSDSFIGYVEHYGRSFEFGLATRYHLTHHPLSLLRKGGLGFTMIMKGRLGAVPDRIKNMPQLTAILNEAKRLAAAEKGGEM
jgi:heterodisulfide reductase subunit C/quinone-modifying oxidoreductase subunit QmoC